MKKSILATAIALSSGLFASTAMAVLPPIEITGGTVNFSGNLVPAACEVSVASQNMAIDLGVIDKGTLNTSNAFHQLTPFDITLENCDTSISTALDMAFTATNATGDYAMNEATDSPSDAQLALRAASSGANVPLDGTVNTMSREIITDGTVVLTYTPQYKSTTSQASNITAGNTLYNVTYKVIYQ